MRLKRFSTLLFTILTIITLVACKSNGKGQANSNKPAEERSSSKSEEKTKSTSKETQSSSKESGEKDNSGFSEKREASDDGNQSAPKDKIYAKGHGSVSYNSSDGQIKAQVPSYEGYTEEKVKEALGEPEAVIRDPKYLTRNFRNQEIKNLKSLYLDQHLTKEQLSAFGAAVADVAVGVGLAGGEDSANSYVLYSYKNNEVFLVFYKGQLLYITPDPDYLNFE
ncbi:DUF4947 domain-containing protein [Streptococcus gordonii]|uniref:DUF4947 domain-containing protein n=1 Tax=Streptococcus gordonii TaxID=1302 RepID=UPI0022E7D598|nr:DUF4947 domain-containing protein [Streptococcus gordonii]